MNGEKVMNRWFVVIGAILIQLCLGAIYAWSVFTPHLVKAGWAKVDTQWVFSVGLAVFAIVMVWAGKKLTTYGPRKLAMMGGLTLGAGYALAGLLGGTNFWVLMLLIGVVGGAGIGLGYVVPIAVGMRWFPDKKGLITGLAVAGFGFGALGWVKFADNWLQLIARYELSGTFLIYGVTFAVLVLLGSTWMVFPPEGWKPEGYTPPAAVAGGPAPAGSVDWKGTELLCTPQFYLIFLAFVITGGAGLMSIGLMKLYPMEVLQQAGMSKVEASVIAGTAMGVFFSLANGVGRIAWGSLSDKIGRKLSVVLMAGSQGVFFLAFNYMVGSEYLLYLGATIIGFNFGGNFALFPTFTADTFGAKNVGQNYPLVFLAYGVGGILGPLLGGLMGDLKQFPLAYTISGVLCLVGAGLAAVVNPPTKACEPPQ